MWKTFLIAAVALVIGILGGTYYTQRDLEVTNSMGLAARVIRQDRVLTYLEQGDIERAKKVQAEFLKSSLLELGDERAWPTEVQAIVNKRKMLEIGK